MSDKQWIVTYKVTYYELVSAPHPGTARHRMELAGHQGRPVEVVDVEEATWPTDWKVEQNDVGYFNLVRTHQATGVKETFTNRPWGYNYWIERENAEQYAAELNNE